MADTKIKREKFTSPKGPFSWPKIVVPDTKFKPEGEYSVKLLLDTDSREAQRLIKQIDDAAAESLAEHKAKAKNKAEANKWETKSVPYQDVLDEESGEPTGTTEFTFKMTASGVYKTGPKAGQKWERSPSVYDAAGSAIVGKKLAGLKIGGGTLGKVSYELMKWGTLQLGASVKLALEAVQIIDLVEWGSRDAKSFGFGAEEGGFSSDSVSENDEDEEDNGEFGDSSEDEAGSAADEQDDF